MNNSLKSFEELECWKTCTELRRYISLLIKKFPKDEQYSLIDQMRRASRLTTHNIAEGFVKISFSRKRSIL